MTLSSRQYKGRIYLEKGRLDSAEAQNIEDQSNNVDKGHWSHFLRRFEIQARNLDFWGYQCGGVQQNDREDELIQEKQQRQVWRRVQDSLVAAMTTSSAWYQHDRSHDTHTKTICISA